MQRNGVFANVYIHVTVHKAAHVRERHRGDTLEQTSATAPEL